MRRETIFFAIAAIGLALVAFSAWRGDSGMRDASGAELFQTLLICAGVLVAAHLVRKLFARHRGDGEQ